MVHGYVHHLKMLDRLETFNSYRKTYVVFIYFYIDIKLIKRGTHCEYLFFYRIYGKCTYLSLTNWRCNMERISSIEIVLESGGGDVTINVDDEGISTLSLNKTASGIEVIITGEEDKTMGWPWGSLKSYSIIA